MRFVFSIAAEPHCFFFHALAAVFDTSTSLATHIVGCRNKYTGNFVLMGA